VKERLEKLIPGAEFDLRSLIPGWFEAHCPALFEEREIFLQQIRPPFWLRAQRGTSADLVHELSRESISAIASPEVPWAVRVNERVDLEEHAIVTSGRAEVQDIGSQALLAMVAPETGGQWLDFCAGAGGKSLQLSRLVGLTGRVTSYDVRRDALMELKRRMIRARIENIKIEPVLPETGITQFDGVLLDAPCSASGTWRRHPFLRHQTTPEVIDRRAREQIELLNQGSEYVRRGGRLVYATCSLSRKENEDVVTAFLNENQDFKLEEPALLPGMTPSTPPWVTLMPSFLDSDGYFLACMRRE
jgi:16S rRNA (cytosine967-C5)-methyltransferase